MLLGAEDKFPIFLYVVLRAVVRDLRSQYVFMREFCPQDDEVGLEAVFRLAELAAAMDFLRTLDWNIRDKRGCLVPLSSIQDQA